VVLALSLEQRLPWLARLLLPYQLLSTYCGDATYEQAELFVVNLTAPSNATLADSQGVGTITDGDSATRVISYGYDGLLRLTNAAETPGNAYAYSYDLAGNRTQAQVNGVTTESRIYNTANQVAGYTYDLAGNLINDNIDEVQKQLSVVNTDD
jgi:YD repeat-containing protein